MYHQGGDPLPLTSIFKEIFISQYINPIYVPKVLKSLFMNA